jgi:hypothetical protein
MFKACGVCTYTQLKKFGRSSASTTACRAGGTHLDVFGLDTGGGQQLVVVRRLFERALTGGGGQSGNAE